MRAARPRSGTGPGANASRFANVTVLGVLGAEGMVDAMSVAAATSAAVFLAKPHRGLRQAYLDQALLPALRRTRPDAVLVTDSLAAHKAAQARALLDASGLACRYLHACSPDLNPIEPASAKVKAALHEACGPALAAITPQDATGFFRHCGYVRPG